VTSRAPGALAAVAASTLLALVLSGCGSTDEPAESDAPATTSEEASDSPSEPATDTAPETPAVEPADGVPLKVKGMTAHAPKDWVAGPDFVSQAGANPPGVNGTRVVLYSFPVFGNLTMTLDDLAKDSTSSGDWQRKAERQDDVVVDGVDAFHVAGQVNPGERVDVYGTVLDDKQLTIRFNWTEGEDRAYRDEVIGSVLASVDLAG
jgi:hypothetical protein